MISRERTGIRILKVLEILTRETDEDHPLTVSELAERLLGQGISCDRRTLYADLRALRENGYEILNRRGRYCNEYYVADRGFDVPELRVMIDAVQAASFITEKKTAELIDKIAALGGSNRADIIRRNMVRFNATKHTNERIYYSIFDIESGILDRKQIEFAYFDLAPSGRRVFRRDGKKYIVNPAAMVCTGDNYYLVCWHDKYGNTASYRIDRMYDVRVTDTPINEKTRPKDLDVPEHRKQAFSMFGGRAVRVFFEADGSVLDVVYDKFGEDLGVRDAGGGKVTFGADIQISPVFFGWCCTLGEKLRILFPERVKNEYIGWLNAICGMYEKSGET